MATEEKADDSAAMAAAASAGTDGGGGGGNKIVLILTAVNFLATLGIAGALYVGFQKDKKQAQVTDIAPEAGEHEGAKGEGKGEHGEAKSEHGEGKPEGKKGGPDFGKMMTLEQFTVNMSTPGSPNPKFVRVNMSLEVPSADAESEVTQRMPQVRNVVIDLFNSKRPADLATAEGRDHIKDEIKNAINSFLVTGKVKGVFFTNFVVSS